MKKNRPGTLLTVVAPPALRAALTDIIFRETTTIGLRLLRGRPRVPGARDRDGRDAGRRRCASRWRRATAACSTPTPEFEDCATLAAAHNLPVKDVQALAVKAYERHVVSRFFLTTAIDYVNSRPHLGTAYEKICADVIARYKRLCGFETRFLMGNDEHSQNVFKKAAEEGLDPLAYCDQMEREFRKTWAHLDVSFDDFIRTTEPRHKAGVTELAQAALRRRRHLRRRLRRLVLRRLRGVQAGEGSRRRQLPAAPDADAGVDHARRTTSSGCRSISSRCSPTSPRIPEFLQPDVAPQRDPAACSKAGSTTSRSAAPGSRGAFRCRSIPASVVYVWFDALINYASAVGLGTDQALFAKWWPADLHVIGKDITRFHAVIWPAMLMARGAAAAAPGLRPRLHDAERPADEQDARHDRRSDRGGAIASASIRCGCIW